MARRISRRRRLETRLLELSTPLFLLDANRRVVFFNAGCERLTGWRSSDVIGRVCDYAPPGDSRDEPSIGWLLAPPPSLFADRRPVSVPATLPDPDGKPAAKLIHFHPLVDGEGAIDLVLGTFGDLSGPSPPVAASAAPKLHAELAAIRAQLRQRYGLRSLVARSEPMLRVAEQMKLAIAAQSPVLVVGERGTGREHVARVIHNESPAGARSFIPLDCGRLPMREIRNTLQRVLRLDQPPDAPRGYPDAAPAIGLLPGTVFLHSVEKLGRDQQELLVNAYRESSPKLPAGVRLMAGTAVDLQQAVTNDAVRSDFYFLLTTLPIELPPLRNRPDDLEPLAQFLLEESNRGSDRQIGGFSDAVWEQFRQYHWPGNVDELAAVVLEARSACEGTTIDVRHLPFRFRTGLESQSVGPAIIPQSEPLEVYLARMEAERIRSVLQQVRHNKTLAAKSLGMTRPRLYRRMEALGIEDLE